MFDRVAIRVSDRARSEPLYGAVLEVLGVAPSHRDERSVAWNDLVMLAADREHPPTRHLHVGFVAPSREAVREFWRVGLELGASSDGEPGERPQYTPGYYGAFLLDPDGNSIEAVIHDDVRRGGNVDHLWIGVRDLDGRRSPSTGPSPATRACETAASGRPASSSGAPGRPSRCSPTDAR